MSKLLGIIVLLASLSVVGCSRSHLTSLPPIVAKVPFSHIHVGSLRGHWFLVDGLGYAELYFKRWSGEYQLSVQHMSSFGPVDRMDYAISQGLGFIRSDGMPINILGESYDLALVLKLNDSEDAAPVIFFLPKHHRSITVGPLTATYLLRLLMDGEVDDNILVFTRFSGLHVHDFFGDEMSIPGHPLSE